MVMVMAMGEQQASEVKREEIENDNNDKDKKKEEAEEDKEEEVAKHDVKRQRTAADAGVHDDGLAARSDRKKTIVGMAGRQAGLHRNINGGGGMVLPGGWIECATGGDVAISDVFVPMKTPLDSSWDPVVPVERRHSISSVLKKQTQLGRKIGLVVDLTKGDRYYDGSEWERNGVQYRKLRCVGHGSSPTPQEVDLFHEIVYNWRQVNGDSHIIVHCTHGHNRTGFMIVHHLLRVSIKTKRVADFVTQFAQMRPPGIYKKQYLEDLFTAYHEHWPSALRNPHLPEWKEKKENDEDDPPESINLWKATVGSSGQNISHGDIVGEEIDVDHERRLQVLISSILLQRSIVPSEVNFAGSQPVSLDRNNVTMLNDRPYRVTWKADGTRYMILLCLDGVYLVGRDNRIRRVWVRFPYYPKEAGIPPTRHNFTLLDGEMVVDKDVKTGKLERRLLVFDVMCICGQPCVQQPFSFRFEAIDREVMNLRKYEQQKCQPQWYDWAAEPFKVRRKDFWELSAAEKVLTKLIPQLTHESDGLILQCWNDPYIPRTCDEILKWKYGNMNSVDFKLKFDRSTNGIAMLYILEKKQLRHLPDAKVIFPPDEDPSAYHGGIIECSWEEDIQSWKFMRLRTDKLTPNSMDVYLSVKKSIDDNITQEELLDIIEQALDFPAYQHGKALPQQQPVPDQKDEEKNNTKTAS